MSNKAAKPVTIEEIASGVSFPVTITEADVDLIKVGGATFALGQALMAASLPVTLASNQTWTGATNLGKAEDALHVSGDTGVMLLAVRNDAGTTFSGDGDYCPLQVNSGNELRVIDAVARTFLALINTAQSDGSQVTSVSSLPSITILDTTSTDYDTTGGITNQLMMGIALPGIGGPVAGGTTTNPVVVNQNTAASTIPAQGSVAGTALTGTYATVLAPGGIYAILMIWNSTDKAISLSLDGGTTTHFVLERGENTVSVDFAANGKIGPNSNIQAKHNGVVPTIGTVRATVIR